MPRTTPDEERTARHMGDPPRTAPRPGRGHVCDPLGPTHQRRAVLMGVVRHEVNRSAGRSGIMGSSSLASQAASWMQFFMDGGSGTCARGWFGLMAATCGATGSSVTAARRRRGRGPRAGAEGGRRAAGGPALAAAGSSALLRAVLPAHVTLLSARRPPAPWAPCRLF